MYNSLIVLYIALWGSSSQSINSDTNLITLKWHNVYSADLAAWGVLEILSWYTGMGEIGTMPLAMIY